MKLYKYRALSAPDDEAFERLSYILHQNAFWCARPCCLNDPNEFLWDCDYEPTDATVLLLTKTLIQFLNRTPAQAHAMATASVSSRRIEVHAKPAFQAMIEKCRSEIGLACFGTSSDNAVMWQRYGGDGAGVCIEIDVPPLLLNDQLFPVEYPAAKILHIDQLLRACLEPAEARTVYTVALLSKPPSWAPEAEVRFVSKRQNVSVQLSGSFLSRIVLGPRLERHSRQRIQDLVHSLPYGLPLSFHGA
jgi:hypothetical protein